MIRKIIKVSDNNFRKFDDPLGNETPRKYIFYAKTCDVPEGIPMSTNPRDQKLNSTVANAITESLLSNDGQFHLKNRGIILSAKRVRYDNRLQEVTIDFEDGRQRSHRCLEQAQSRTYKKCYGFGWLFGR